MHKSFVTLLFLIFGAVGCCCAAEYEYLVCESLVFDKVVASGGGYLLARRDQPGMTTLTMIKKRKGGAGEVCWQRNLFIQRDYIEGICVRLLRESGLYPELVKRLEILGERHQCIRDVYGFNNVIDKNTAINIDDEGFYMNFFNRKVKLSGSIFSEEDRFFDAIDKEGSAAFAPLEHVDAGIVEQGVLKPKKEVRVGAVVESSQVLDDVQRSCLGPVPADIGSSKESVSSEKPPVKVLTSIPTVRASADERQVLTRESDVLSPIEEKQGGYVLVEAREKFVRCGKDLVNMRLDNIIYRRGQGSLRYGVKKVRLQVGRISLCSKLQRVLLLDGGTI